MSGKYLYSLFGSCGLTFVLSALYQNHSAISTYHPSPPPQAKTKKSKIFFYINSNIYRDYVLRRLTSSCDNNVEDKIGASVSDLSSSSSSNDNNSSNYNNNSLDDSEIPQRFLRGCNNDIVEARRRYDITQAWRKANNIDNILKEKQPHFFFLKKIYPHYTCGLGKGGDVIYWERAGELHMDQIVSSGVSVDEALRHWLFITEYQWNILCKGNIANARSIAVIDIGKCHAGSLWGPTYEFVQKTVTYANMHYPDRSQSILIINAPWWFAYMWRVILPWVHEVTRKKVRILDRYETLSGLQEYIDLDSIPIFYGGNLKFGDDPNNLDCCRFMCPEALALDKYVTKLNNGTLDTEDEDAREIMIYGDAKGGYNLATRLEGKRKRRGGGMGGKK